MDTSPSQPKDAAAPAERKAARRYGAPRSPALFLVGLLLAGWFFFEVLYNVLPFFSIYQSGTEAVVETTYPALTATPLTEDTRAALAAKLADYPTLEPVLLAPQQYPDVVAQKFLEDDEWLDYLLGWPGEPLYSIGLEEDLQAGGIPHLMQWDRRWGYDSYGEDVLGLTGCGPVCLSMVAAGLTGNPALHPLAVARLAEEKGYYIPGTGTSWELMTDCAELGITGHELPLHEATIAAHLEAGEVVICSVRPGDFTATGHFLVLAGLAPDGGFEVLDPTSHRQIRSWAYKDLSPQIANLWAFSPLPADEENPPAAS